MNERGIEQQMEIKVTNIAGWWYTYPSEQYEFVSWDDSSQYMESHKKCSTPPTTLVY